MKIIRKIIAKSIRFCCGQQIVIHGEGCRIDFKAEKLFDHLRNRSNARDAMSR